ncbi:AAA-associated domain-containing protein [Streptomyces sp. NPDC087787]|uniref:AAA-associated domain-containing protein n=1 Tax=Streptomyces sp. NPDC087787 TaxID=3365803 RepID=UPI0037F91347
MSTAGLWESGQFPTRAIVLVTRNIGEAVLMADRIVVLGADVQESKTIFGRAAIQLPLVKVITSSVRGKADGTARAGFFRDLLAHHYTSEQVDQQLETATDWGRYGELYAYDAGPGEYRRDDAGDAAGVTGTP